MTLFLPLWAELMSFLAAEAHVHDMIECCCCCCFGRTDSVEFEERWKVSASWELTHRTPFNTGPTIINDVTPIYELNNNQSNEYTKRVILGAAVSNWTKPTLLSEQDTGTSKQLTLMSHWIILTENQWINLQRFKEWIAQSTNHLRHWINF